MASPINPCERKGVSKKFFPLKRLPLDILLLVADNLSPSDAVCLGLTYKEIWSTLQKALFSSNRHINNWSYDEKLILLSRLDSDSPAHILCHRCEKLHSRVTSDEERATALTGGPMRLCSRVTAGDEGLKLCNHVLIGYETFSLMLKSSHNQLPPSSTSLPVSILRHKCSITRQLLGREDYFAPLIVSIRPKIVRDRLLLRVDRRAGVLTISDLREQLKFGDLRSCWRHDDLSNFEEDCVSTLHEIKRGKDLGLAQRKTVGNWKRIRKCDCCVTEAFVRAFEGSDDMWILQIRTYMDLGRRIDGPYSQPWQGHTNLLAHAYVFNMSKDRVANINLMEVFEESEGGDPIGDS